jgi:hypothetical protein
MQSSKAAKQRSTQKYNYIIKSKLDSSYKNNYLVLQSGVFSLSIKDIQKGLTFIEGFFYSLKVIHILRLLLAILIYFLIKLPINQCIYGYFNS